MHTEVGEEVEERSALLLSQRLKAMTHHVPSVRITNNLVKGGGHLLGRFEVVGVINAVSQNVPGCCPSGTQNYVGNSVKVISNIVSVQAELIFDTLGPIVQSDISVRLTKHRWIGETLYF